MACPFYGYGQPTLHFEAGSGDAPGQNLALVVEETAKKIRVFVVNVFDPGFLEEAELLADLGSVAQGCIYRGRTNFVARSLVSSRGFGLLQGVGSRWGVYGIRHGLGWRVLGVLLCFQLPLVVVLLGVFVQFDSQKSDDTLIVRQLLFQFANQFRVI